MFKKIALMAALAVSSLAFADKSEFCKGFEEGYRSVAGNLAILPICPIAPITPIGSTPFREGIKVGIQQAKDEGK